MPISKLINCTLAGTLTLTFSILSSSLFSAIAQRQPALIQFPLLDNSVFRHFTSGGSYAWNIYNYWFIVEKQEIIVKRQLFASQFEMRAQPGQNTVLAYGIDIDDFDNLTLQMMTSDDAVLRQQQATITIYQGGNAVSTYSDITGGSIISTDLTLNYSAADNPGDISIEMACADTTAKPGCIVYFSEAELSPTGNFISPR